MKLNKSKILFLSFSILFLCSLLGPFVLANDIQKRGLETNYPEINGIKITATSTIETYAVYLFSISMIIGAILAFAVLIYGGMRYVTSSGNPDAMSDAKKWILGAILGLMLLLCAWFVIGIINKEMLSPKIPDIEATLGIYIVDKNGEKIPYSEKMVRSIPEYIEVDYIEFISDKPADEYHSDPNKNELFSVFVYSKENFQGTVEEIPNPGAGMTHNISNIGSMFLLWWEPGIYLYDKEDFKTDLLYPRFYNKSQMNLKEFDNKAKSLRRVNIKPEETSYPFPTPQTQIPGGSYYVILFEKPNFNKESSGRCAFTTDNKTNFSGDEFSQIQNTVSSIIVFKTKEIHGEVILYDEIGQKGNESLPKTLTGDVAAHITLEESGLDIWNSISINANATVIINTEEEGVHKGYCRPFSQYSKDGDDLKNTSVRHICYGQQSQGQLIGLPCVEYSPKRATIFPRQE